MHVLEIQRVNAVLLVDQYPLVSVHRFGGHHTLRRPSNLARRCDEMMEPGVDLVLALSLARLLVRLIVVRGWQQGLEVFEIGEHGRFLLIA